MGEAGGGGPCLPQCLHHRHPPLPGWRVPRKPPSRSCSSSAAAVPIRLFLKQVFPPARMSLPVLALAAHTLKVGHGQD